jgi:hypothetical protein
MVKENNGYNQPYFILDSYFENFQYRDQALFIGHQLVEYLDGDYGIVSKKIGVKTGENKNAAYSLECVHEKGKKKEIKELYHIFKRGNFNVEWQDLERFRHFELKENEKIIAKVINIEKNIKYGIAELKLIAGDKKLTMKLKNKHVESLKEGQEISINGTKDGIRIILMKEQIRKIGKSLA